MYFFQPCHRVHYLPPVLTILAPASFLSAKVQSLPPPLRDRIEQIQLSVPPKHKSSFLFAGCLEIIGSMVYYLLYQAAFACVLFKSISTRGRYTSHTFRRHRKHFSVGLDQAEV